MAILLQKAGQKGYRLTRLILKDSVNDICVAYQTMCVLFTITISDKHFDEFIVFAVSEFTLLPFFLHGIWFASTKLFLLAIH